MDYNKLARNAYSTFCTNNGNQDSALNTIPFDQLTPRQREAWEAVAKNIVEEVPNVRAAGQSSR